MMVIGNFLLWEEKLKNVDILMLPKFTFYNKSGFFWERLNLEVAQFVTVISWDMVILLYYSILIL